MSDFDFSAPADVYMTTARGAQRRPLTYRRFDNAAEAVRFAIEDLGQDVQRGTVMEVDGDRFPSTVIDDLKRILARFPGQCSVDMYVRAGAAARRLRFGDGFRVDPQASLFAELKELLGEGCVGQGVGPPAGGIASED